MSSIEEDEEVWDWCFHQGLPDSQIENFIEVLEALYGEN